MTATVESRVTCKNVFEVVVDLDADLGAAAELLYHMAWANKLGPDEMRSRLYGIAKGVRRQANDLREQGDGATADEIVFRMERLYMRMDYQAEPTNGVSPRKQLVQG